MNGNTQNKNGKYTYHIHKMCCRMEDPMFCQLNKLLKKEMKKVEHINQKVFVS